MIRIMKILFNGKKPVNVQSATTSQRIGPERKRLTRELKAIDKSAKKITYEVKKMKRQIDTALALAVATGGLK